MVKFKEFFSTFTNKAIDMLNEFLEENNIEYVDLKIFDSSHFLLIYKKKEMNKMEMKPKFKPGEEVFWIGIHNNEINKSYCELSRDIVEAVMIYEDYITYWLASCDSEVSEDNIVEYDEKKLFEFLNEKLSLNTLESIDR